MHNMKKFLIILLIIICFATACEGNANTIIKVIDGDSLYILQNGKRIEVRLYGIDAPEYGQSFGTQAIGFLKQKALNQSAKIERINYDKHGRMVAIVYVNGESLQSMLVENGFAWVYPRYCKKNICDDWLKLQEKAKNESKGLWKKHNPMPPWQWRRK